MAKEITIEKAAEKYLEGLKEDGKSDATITIYANYLADIVGHFGGDKGIEKLQPMNIGAYFKSDAMLLSKTGKKKSDITIAQNKRVFKQMLMWAKDKGYVDDIPFPKAELERKVKEKAEKAPKAAKAAKAPKATKAAKQDEPKAEAPATDATPSE